MWNFNAQIKLRWFFFFLAMAALVAGYLFLKMPDSGSFSRIDLLELQIRLSVYSEFINPLFILPIFLLILLFLLAGCPSVIIFSIIYLANGFAIAFFSVTTAQMLASLITIYWSRKKGKAVLLPAGLAQSIKVAGISPASMTLWPRLYLSYPLRTTDLIVAAVIPEDEPSQRIYLPGFLAIIIRNILPFIWATYFLGLFFTINLNPEQASADFLVWSSLLLIYIAVPKVPELLPCKASIKPILQDIENWSCSNAAAGEPSKRSRNRIKLGMQARPSQQT